MAGAMAFVWAAALAKEIGITCVGTMILLDLLLVPFTIAQPLRSADHGYNTLPCTALANQELPFPPWSVCRPLACAQHCPPACSAKYSKLHRV